MNKWRISLRFRHGATAVTYAVAGSYSYEGGLAWCDQWREERGNSRQAFEIVQIVGKITGVNLRDKDRRL
jgi:hypothetical protein